MSKQKNKPIIWSYEKLTRCNFLDEFNSYHGTNVDCWINILPSLGGFNCTSNDVYSDYENWYIVRFSKLGQALK